MGSEQELMSEQAEQLRFAALRNIYYHSARRYALERSSRIMNFLIIIAGTATASSAFSVLKVSTDKSGLILGGVTTALGAMQLVFDFALRAKNHEILAKSYFKLLAEIDGTVSISEDFIADLKRKFSEVASEEPPAMRALSALAYNEAAQALYGEDVPLIEVGFWKRLLRNVFKFGGMSMKTAFPK